MTAGSETELGSEHEELVRVFHTTLFFLIVHVFAPETLSERVAVPPPVGRRGGEALMEAETMGSAVLAEQAVEELLPSVQLVLFVVPVPVCPQELVAEEVQGEEVVVQVTCAAGGGGGGLFATVCVTLFEAEPYGPVQSM